MFSTVVLSAFYFEYASFGGDELFGGCAGMCSMSMNGLPPRVRLPRQMDANLYVSRLSPARFRRLFLALFQYVPTFCLQFKKVVTPGTGLQPSLSLGTTTRY